MSDVNTSELCGEEVYELCVRAKFKVLDIANCPASKKNRTKNLLHVRAYVESCLKAVEKGEKK